MTLWTSLTRNHAATRTGEQHTGLQPLRCSAPFATVWAAVECIARGRPRWTVTEADPAAGTLHARARTRTWGFVDDVRIDVSLDPTGLTRVDVESKSRVGRADFGTNARRIRAFLRVLGRELEIAGNSSAAPEPR